MRDAFPEFYQPTSDDERRFIVDGTVVVDANVLLALYELSVVERNQALEALEKIGDRLWIPYQVGLEYQRGRLGVIQRQAKSYTRLVDLHGARDLDGLAEALSRITLPPEVADEVRPLLTPLAQRLNEATMDYVAAATQIRDRHVVTVEQGVNDDPVRKRLDKLFVGRVGQRPTDKAREGWIDEAKRRRAAQIPPGYMDSKKESEELNAGDYLLWAELLEHAQSTAGDGKPFLLVTNDTKNDWYAKPGGEPSGPRPELVREFYACSPHGYHQVTLGGMLRLARSHLAVDIGDATIEKASELSRPDFVYIDESSGRLLVGEVKLYPGERRRAISMLVDRLLDWVLGETRPKASSVDFEVLGRRLTHVLLDEARQLADLARRESWSEEDAEIIARAVLRDVLAEEVLPGRSTRLDDVDLAMLELFLTVIRTYGFVGRSDPDEDR